MFRLLPVVFLLATACGEVVRGQPDGNGPQGPQTLTVTLVGGGSVDSAPGGIACGTTCSATFDAQSSVTLTPTADAASAFVGWSGDCAGTGPCTVTMDGAKAVTATFALHGAKRWVAQVSFSGQDSMERIIVDPDGNVIAGGAVRDDAGSDLYIIKYAKEDGHVIWKQRFVTPTAEDLGGLVTDAAGDVYLGTRLSGFGTTAMFGTTTVTGDLFGNIVVLRLAAATGNVVWAKQWGGDGQDIPQAIAVSGNSLYVVGYTSSSPSTFDGLTIAGSTNNGFVARANTSDGKATVVKPLAGNVSTFDLAVNGGDVAVVGLARGTFAVDAGCNVNVSGAGEDAMIIDLNGATLACKWSKAFGDITANINAAIYAVAAFPGGGWVVTGGFDGNILLAASGSSLSSRGMTDVFAGRFAADGTHIWSFRYGDTGTDVGYGISVTPEGSTLLAGVFDATVTFGTITVTGARNTFVTRMSADNAPHHEWAVSLGGNDTDTTDDVAVAPDGSLYVLTSFTGMTDIAGTPLTSMDYDAWIAALVR